MTRELNNREDLSRGERDTPFTLPSPSSSLRLQPHRTNDKTPWEKEEDAINQGGAWGVHTGSEDQMTGIRERAGAATGR